MNSKYTGKQIEYLLDKISSLSSGDVGDFIGTELLDKFLRKDQDERTPHSLASDKKLEVGNFVSGTAGAVIYIDEQTKHSVAEIDKLYVRLKAYFEQLEIINVNSVGGKQIISPAGGIKCSQVETYDSWGYYRCYFLSEQDGEKESTEENSKQFCLSTSFLLPLCTITSPSCGSSLSASQSVLDKSI